MNSGNENKSAALRRWSRNGEASSSPAASATPGNAASEKPEVSGKPACAEPAWRKWFRTAGRRVLLGAAVLTGLFLLYRLLWLTSWYWPYVLIRSYVSDHLPMAPPWAAETVAACVGILVLAQAGSILGFVFFGTHKRLMLALALAGLLLHAGLGWYSYGRVAVDSQGRVQIRVVERPGGALKVIDREFDPETGIRSRWATKNDLIMLDLQRRGVGVVRVGASGPFRSPQGSIIVYYARAGGRLRLYSGPRHHEVSGDMKLATEQVLRAFINQEQGLAGN